jgi:hypothetical protein
MSSKIFAYLRYISVGIGIFFAFNYFFSNELPTSIHFINVFCVGFVGLVSFFSHFVFHKTDAKMLGWEKGNPNFQFEVGFANLSFSIIAFSGYLGKWGTEAESAIIIGYSLYLLMASFLHIYLFFKKDNEHKRPFIVIFLGFLFPVITMFFPITFFVK